MVLGILQPCVGYRKLAITLWTVQKATERRQSERTQFAITTITRATIDVGVPKVCSNRLIRIIYEPVVQYPNVSWGVKLMLIISNLSLARNAI